MTCARQDTWMPLYWGDYLRDTRHLTAAEHGAYLLLIGHYWVTGVALPDDDDRLSRVAAMTQKEWAKHRPVICKFFTITKGEWRHGRIDAEIAVALSNIRKQRDRTAAANEAKRLRNEQRNDGRNETRNEIRIGASENARNGKRNEPCNDGRYVLHRAVEGEGLQQEGKGRVGSVPGDDPPFDDEAAA